jgi:hypothetical protein
LCLRGMASKVGDAASLSFRDMEAPSGFTHLDNIFF